MHGQGPVRGRSEGRLLWGVQSTRALSQDNIKVVSGRGFNPSIFPFTTYPRSDSEHALRRFPFETHLPFHLLSPDDHCGAPVSSEAALGRRQQRDLAEAS
jgi:hypothetical protein